MLKHHPHSTSLSVVAVSYQPIQSLTLYSNRQQRSGIYRHRNMVLKFLRGQTCPQFCGPEELFLDFDKEPRERARRQKGRSHAKPSTSGPWRLTFQRPLQRAGLQRGSWVCLFSHRFAEGPRGQGKGRVEERQGGRSGVCPGCLDLRW